MAHCVYDGMGVADLLFTCLLDLIAGTLVGLIAAYIVYRLFLKVSGYKTMKKVPHIYAPILVGGLTIVGILIYSTVMILQAQN